MEISWNFRGSKSLRSKHVLILGRFSWVFCGIFVGPLKTKLVALWGGYRGLFVDAGAPPALENMRKPTLESTEKNIFLSQVPPPQPGSHARGQ